MFVIIGLLLDSKRKVGLKMKILVICQYYYPEPFRISDICEELAKRGNEVFVVTGQPNYPMGKLYKGYGGKNHRDEVVNGVKVHRCFTVARGKGLIKRFLNYYSFAFSSSHYVSRIKDDFDVVFVNQLSPVMMAKAGVKYKKKHSKKLFLYCLDLWPESLAAGGIKRNSEIYSYYHKISEKLYKSADKIAVTSRSFTDYFEKEFGISDARYLPQYSEEIFSPDACRKTPDDYTDLMFAGNVGVMQDIDTIIKAARLTADNKNLRWHIVGDGSELERIKETAEDSENIIFHGRQPLEKMPEYYAMADAMLVTLKDNPSINLTLPGKVQTYMAAGKPIIGAINGETALLLKESGCGICGAAESAEELAANVKLFINSDKEAMALKAREYYEAHFNKKVFIDSLIKLLTD